MSDLDEIRRVIALYSQLVDDKRFDEWGELFTTDAVFEARGNRIVGRSSIVGTIGPMMAPAVTKHLAGAPVIDLLDDDRARAWTDLATFVRGEGGVSVATIGRYYDELRREDGRWRLSARVLVMTGDPVPHDCAPGPAA